MFDVRCSMFDANGVAPSSSGFANSNEAYPGAIEPQRGSARIDSLAGKPPAVHSTQRQPGSHRRPSPPTPAIAFKDFPLEWPSQSGVAGSTPSHRTPNIRDAVAALHQLGGAAAFGVRWQSAAATPLWLNPKTQQTSPLLAGETSRGSFNSASTRQPPQTVTAHPGNCLQRLAQTHRAQTRAGQRPSGSCVKSV